MLSRAEIRSCSSLCMNVMDILDVKFTSSKFYGWYSIVPKLTYIEAVEVLSILGKLINYPVFWSSSSFFKPRLHEQFQQDYRSMKNILIPYVKNLSRWHTDFKFDDDLHKFEFTLVELNKIVDDQSHIGFLPGTCSKQDDP